jgi:hypothetical protein
VKDISMGIPSCATTLLLLPDLKAVITAGTFEITFEIS